MARIIIPTPLRKYTNQQNLIESNGPTISSLLDDLIFRFPDLKRHLFENGKIRSFINIFVEDKNIRDLQLERTRVFNHTTVSIVPAIAGG